MVLVLKKYGVVGLGLETQSLGLGLGLGLGLDKKVLFTSLPQSHKRSGLPILEDEVVSALKGRPMAKGKAAGPDGLTVETYARRSRRIWN